MNGERRGDSGSATVEQVGLMLLVALLAIAAAGFLLLSRDPPGRELGQRIANRIACGPSLPSACRRHPAVVTYGWPIARLLRHLAPTALARPDSAGRPLAPVDFRRCQRPSCAVPQAGERGLRLTTANRRVTAFTEVRDRRREGGRVELAYWLYRPGLGWEKLVRHAGEAELRAASGTRVLLKDSPMLVPLESLDGRNHHELPPGDEPPWRWRVSSIYGGAG